jgi:hypothetical protein
MEKSGIPTTYSGYKFRSRLEATWACFFDQCEWKWKYEPIDLKGYIPDFIVSHPHADILIEVKPATNYQDMYPVEKRLNLVGWDKEILIVGCGDLSGEYFPRELPYLPIGRLLDPSLGFWDVSYLFHCSHCGRVSFSGSDGSWHCRVCGHRDRDRHQGDVRKIFNRLWSTSQNMVQWAPKMFGIDTNAR